MSGTHQAAVNLCLLCSCSKIEVLEQETWAQGHSVGGWRLLLGSEVERWSWEAQRVNEVRHQPRDSVPLVIATEINQPPARDWLIVPTLLAARGLRGSSSDLCRVRTVLSKVMNSSAPRGAASQVHPYS